MPTFRVVIPTTESVVEIQSLIEEADGLNSVISIDGGLVEAAISPSYQRFISKPHGVIERETGHTSYRLDVSGEIDTGDSWQLPVYLAHLLSGAGQLAHFDAPAERIIIATGEVRLRGGVVSIEPVSQIREKLIRIRQKYGEAVNADITLVLPAGNTDEIATDEKSSWPDGIKIASVPRGVAGVEAIFKILGLAEPPVPSDHKDEREGHTSVAESDCSESRQSALVRRRPIGRGVLLAGVFSAALVSMAVVYQGFDAPIVAGIKAALGIGGDLSTPNPGTNEGTSTSANGSAPSNSPASIVTSVALEVTMPPENLRCSALRFPPNSGVVRSLDTAGASGVVHARDVGEVCRLRVVLDLLSPRKRSASIIYRVMSSSPDGTSDILKTGVAETGRISEVLLFEVDVPRQRERDSGMVVDWAETDDATVAAGLAKSVENRGENFADVIRAGELSADVVHRQVQIVFLR